MGVGLGLPGIVRSRSAMVLAIITAVLATGIPILITAFLPAADRLFGTVVAPAQLIVSVTVPLLGVLVVGDLHQGLPISRRTLAKRWTTATVIAITAGVLTLVVSAVAVALCSASDRSWDHALMIIIGSLLAQLVAQFTGTGFGLLIRPAPLAMVATVVPPLALFLVFGAVPGLPGLQPWLTPLGSAQNLLSGVMSAVRWAEAAVVFLIWAVVLNAAGALSLSRGHSIGDTPQDQRVE